MESNQNSDPVLEDVENNVENVKIVDCPNCEESVPLSIYCLKCGFPMFDLMKKHMDKDKREIKEVNNEILSKNDIVSTRDSSTELKFRLEPADLNSDKEDDELDIETNHELQHKEEDQTLDLNDDLKIVDTEIDGDEDFKSEAHQSFDRSFHVMNENEQESTMRTEKVKMQKRVFEPDEATRNLMQNLANSINLKLWSIGQLLDEKISTENFERLHVGYDARYRQLMDQRKERLEQVSDVNKLEKELERAYINKSELEIRKTLNDLFEGEFDAKAPAFEWEITHCEILLEHRKGEIAFLKGLEKVVQSEELAEMVKTARNHLESIQSTEGLMELIDGSSARLKNSLEEIVNLLEDN